MTPLKTEVEAKQPETKHEEPKPRFQPIKLRGGSSNAGSEEVIHGRGRDPHSNENPGPPAEGVNLRQLQKHGKRFDPLPIRGEPLSATIIRDRGRALTRYFFDSSAFAKLFIQEAESEAMTGLFEPLGIDEKSISRGDCPVPIHRGAASRPAPNP